MAFAFALAFARPYSRTCVACECNKIATNYDIGRHGRSVFSGLVVATGYILKELVGVLRFWRRLR